jgi:hypothetical protein
MFTNLEISCVGHTTGFLIKSHAYQAFCELWASPEYQEKSAKKRKLGELTGTHAFGVDGYVCMGQ